MKKGYLLLLMFVLCVSPVYAEYYDFGGATVTIVSQGNPASRFIEGTGPEPMVPAYGLHEEAEALFNCKIEFIGTDFGSLPELLLTRVLSGDASHDIWNMNSTHYFVLVAEGVYYPLNDVLPDEYFENLPGMAGAVADYKTFRGERYAFGAWPNVAGLHVIAYSRALFDQLGLPDPQELYLAGEWTWEAMEDIARTATRQGEDGEILYGLGGFVDHRFFHGFAYTNDRASWIVEEDGIVLYSANSPAYLEALNQVRNWVEAGIAKPTEHLVPDQLRVIQGDIAMLLTNASRPYNNVWRNHEGTLDPYALVPLPMGPRAEENVITSQFLHARLLPITAEHPEGLVQLADFLFPIDDYNREVEMQINTFAQDRVTAQILWEMHDNAAVWTAPMNHPRAGLITARDRIADVLLGRRTAAAAMDEIAQEVQTTLDDIWNF